MKRIHKFSAIRDLESLILSHDLHLFLNPGRPMHPEGYFRICWEHWLQGMKKKTQVFLGELGVGT